jgi:hypothetical protein
MNVDGITLTAGSPGVTSVLTLLTITAMPSTHRERRDGANAPSP